MGNRSLLYSLWQLIWRPGYFISDYINGKRQVSFPPVKMLVLMGVASVLMDKITGRAYNSKPTAAGIYINSGKKYIIK